MASVLLATNKVILPRFLATESCCLPLNEKTFSSKRHSYQSQECLVCLHREQRTLSLLQTAGAESK